MGHWAVGLQGYVGLCSIQGDVRILRNKTENEMATAKPRDSGRSG